LANPENLNALADANADAKQLREDPVGYLKDKVNDAGTAAAKQALTEQLAGPPPTNPEDQDAYKFQQGLVGKAVDNAKQTISEGGQSLKNAISQGWQNFKSIFNFNSSNMDTRRRDEIGCNGYLVDPKRVYMLDRGHRPERPLLLSSGQGKRIRTRQTACFRTRFPSIFIRYDALKPTASLTSRPHRSPV
jgi:hypothetical protein